VTLPGTNVSPRRLARVRAERAVEPGERALPRHARRRRSIRALFGVCASAILLFGGSVSVTAALVGPEVSETVGAPLADDAPETIRATVVPLPAEGLPTPEISAVQAAGTALCDDPDVTRTLAIGDDAAVIAAAGGAEAFRTAVATGAAPCLSLGDPQRVWVVIDKLRPYDPIDYGPRDLTAPEGVRSLEEVSLRADAAAALSAMVTAAADAGAGEIAAESAFRSFATQQATYAGHVSDRGEEGADLVSARPGFSEHQSGLAVDVVPCEDTCQTIDDLAGSPQGEWVRAHAWEFGWIVRYDEGRTDVTGYAPEPWHLRYIGTELARAYHDGGGTTLEEFFALPAAPDYAG
jgi:zinc D-Ala-D-Ala carboxypeptidase